MSKEKAIIVDLDGTLAHIEHRVCFVQKKPPEWNNFCSKIPEDELNIWCKEIILAMKARGKDIVTIEGLRDKNGALHPLQEAIIERFAVQCGYCTPGMILAAKALLDEEPEPTEEQVKEALSGNICRCTGYTKIVEAVLAAKEKIRQGA